MQNVQLGRSPCGERGLKFVNGLWHDQMNVSLPVRGAWIEIMPHVSPDKI